MAAYCGQTGSISSIDEDGDVRVKFADGASWTYSPASVVSIDSSASSAAQPVGARVVRGPAWKWGEQDGGVGGQGVVEAIDDDGWSKVKWDKSGKTNSYKNGKDGKFDLAAAPKDEGTKATGRPTAGNRVKLKDGWESCGDASKGPLKTGYAFALA